MVVAAVVVAAVAVVVVLTLLLRLAVVVLLALPVVRTTGRTCEGPCHCSPPCPSARGAGRLSCRVWRGANEAYRRPVISAVEAASPTPDSPRITAPTAPRARGSASCPPVDLKRTNTYEYYREHKHFIQCNNVVFHSLWLSGVRESGHP